MFNKQLLVAFFSIVLLLTGSIGTNLPLYKQNIPYQIRLLKDHGKNTAFRVHTSDVLSP